jgi:hypothetical protein
MTIGTLSAAAHAQTPATGTLKGVVTDPGGAVVTGTLLRIVSWGTDDRLKTVEREMAMHADVNGQFRFELVPGIYDVFVSDPGFAPAVKQVNVDAAKVVVFNVKLKFSRHIKLLP